MMKLRSAMIGFGLIIGMTMIIWWILAISTQSISEFEDEPFGISMHIMAEFATALILILGSILLIRNKPVAIGIIRISLGMLFYTSLASSGYFMDRNEVIPVILFSMILIATSILIILSFRKSAYKNET